MAKRRIVLLISSLGSGGAERVVATLSTRLALEFDVHVVLFSRVIEYDIGSDVHVAILEGGESSIDMLNIAKIPKLARKLTEYCRNNDIDVVLSFLNRPNFVACLAKKNGLR